MSELLAQSLLLGGLVLLLVKGVRAEPPKDLIYVSRCNRQWTKIIKAHQMSKKELAKEQ